MGDDMANNKKIIRKASLVIISILVMLTCAVSTISIWENRIENQFPTWEKVSDIEYRNFESNPDVEMRFTGIDFDVELPNGKHADMVLVDVNVNAPDGANFHHCLAVDYLYKDEWYNVYSMYTGVAAVAWVRGNFHDIKKYPVPCGLFAKDGTYRMFIGGFGSFDIDIIGMEDV